MSLTRVVNATGVILHTNLGRAPFGPEVLARAAALLEGYSNLEFDVTSGERGRRDALAAPLVCELTGAEAALVVNNNAGAVLLALHALAAGKPAAASRAQLVEIGDSFRLPDVMAAGGVEVARVGTVNSTAASDYARAFAAGAALVVVAHRSNFYFEGPFQEPSLAEVVAVARAAGKPVLYDLGSGLLSADVFAGIIPVEEPNVRDAIAAGVDVVTFSGDKLLGGPQAGIIAGKAAAISALRRDPLYRPLRPGKETFALLTATLELYIRGGAALNAIPTFKLLTRPDAELAAVAARVQNAAGALRGCRATIEEDVAPVGGGTLPYLKLPTRGVALRHSTLSPHHLSAALRRLAPPVIGRARADAVFLDMRSVLAEDLSRVEAAFSSWKEGGELPAA